MTGHCAGTTKVAWEWTPEEKSLQTTPKNRHRRCGSYKWTAN